MLDPLDDLAVLDPDVVEEAGLERALGGRRPVKPSGRCPADRAMSKGNIPVGHGGTLGDANGGRFGKAILNWALWTLKGDTNAAKYFTAGGSSADSYQVEQKSLNLLKPF